MIRSLSLLVAAGAFFLMPLHSVFAQEKEIVGYLEKVRLFPEDVLIHVKLDTGADISSLDAEDIVEYKKGGKKWVRFSVRNRFGQQVRLEREVKRMARIKQHSGAPAQSRYVVRVAICLGTAFMEEEVSLVNRSHFTAQMLIGRSFQAGNVIIDPAQTYLVEPQCQIPDSQQETTEEKSPEKKVKKSENAIPTAENKIIKEEVISEEEQ